jgi:hypothetical protein
MLGYYPGTDDPSNWQELLEFIEEPGHLVDNLAYFLGSALLLIAAELASNQDQSQDGPSNRAVRTALDSILDSVSSPESVAIYEGWGL